MAYSDPGGELSAPGVAVRAFLFARVGDVAAATAPEIRGTPLDLPEMEDAFVAIVRRLEDPEDRIERRSMLAGCVLVLSGSMLALVAVVKEWPLWVAVVGLVATAAADVIAALTINRQIRRRHALAWPQRWSAPQDLPY